MLLHQSQRREESLWAEIPLLTPAEVPLACPEWRMDAILSLSQGGNLPVSLRTKCLGIHGVCQIWSVQSLQL